MANLKQVTIVTIVILSFILFIFPAPNGTIYTVFRIFAFISITFLFFQTSIGVQKSEAPTTKTFALINNRPEIGIIFAPAKQRLFYSYHEGMSFEISDNKEKKLDCKKISKEGEVKAVSYSNTLKPQIEDWHCYLWPGSSVRNLTLPSPLC